MKVTPTAGPVIQQPGPSGQAQADARERAMAKLTQPVQHSVNQNSIAPEEMSAIIPPSQEAPELVEEVTEEVTTTAKEEQKAKETESNQYVLLARKEKALRAKAQQQEAQFKQREQALQQREQEINKIKSEYESGYISKQRLKERTLDALAEAGVTYDEVTQAQIDAGSVAPAVRAQLERLEARLAKQDEELTKFRKGSEEQQGEAYKAAVRQIRQDAQELVSQDPEFEMIKATNSVKDVVELIEATFKDEGRVMTVEEAAKEVEAHLLEEIDKLTRLEKIKKRLAPKPAAQERTNAQPPQSKQPQPMKTLTNATSSTRQMSAKERAILAFKGELKS